MKTGFVGKADEERKSRAIGVGCCIVCVLFDKWIAEVQGKWKEVFSAAIAPAFYGVIPTPI
jgi:hypothetical protein